MTSEIIQETIDVISRQITLKSLNKSKHADVFIKQTNSDFKFRFCLFDVIIKYMNTGVFDIYEERYDDLAKIAEILKTEYINLYYNMTSEQVYFYIGDDFWNCEKKIILCSTTKDECIIFDIVETETNKWSNDEIQRFIFGFNKYLSSEPFNNSKFEFETINTNKK
jgi:hypothetical protein